MSDLIVKEVELLGDTIMAAQDVDGNIWAGVRWFCNGLGLTRGQINNENNRIQTDITLKRGCTKFNAGVFDPNNETLSLKLDFVPLWLAKIPITPKMKEENPDLAEKLVDYQLKAKDVLAAAFLPNKGRSFEDILIEELQEQKKIKQSVRVIDVRVDKLENTMTIDYGQQLELRGLAKNVTLKAVGGKESKAYTYQYPRQDENDNPPKLYGKLFSRLWNDYQDYFRINSYKNTPVARYDEAKEYLRNWEPPINMQLEIEKINRGEM